MTEEISQMLILASASLFLALVISLSINKARTIGFQEIPFSYASGLTSVLISEVCYHYFFLVIS